MLHETHVNAPADESNNKRQGLVLLKNSFPEGKAKHKTEKATFEFIFHM